MSITHTNSVRVILRFCVGLLLSGALAPQCAFGQVATQRREGAIVRLDRVPFPNAVEKLARKACVNYIVDPRVNRLFVGADGMALKRPAITALWTNVTPGEALERLLEKHDLKMVTNPVTCVARIVSAGRRVDSPSANPVLGGKSEVVPMLILDGVRVPDAITHVAQALKVKVEFDKELRVPSASGRGIPISECDVSVRWEDLTSQQALGALLDNYDLVMVESADGSSALVTAKGRTSGNPARISGGETTGL